jgi:transposase
MAAERAMTAGRARHPDDSGAAAGLTGTASQPGDVRVTNWALLL